MGRVEGGWGGTDSEDWHSGKIRLKLLIIFVEFSVFLVFSNAMCACKRCIICVISGWMHLIISKNHFTNRCPLLLFLALIILCSCKLFFPRVLVFPPCLPAGFLLQGNFASQNQNGKQHKRHHKAWKMLPRAYFNITTRFVPTKKMNF